MTLFDVGTVKCPHWYAPSDSRKGANLLVLKGKHPTWETSGELDGTPFGLLVESDASEAGQ